MLRKYYPELIRLWLIAWKNSPIVLTHPSHKLSFLNRKDKDLIISGLEKLWSDFIFVLNDKSRSIYHILSKLPERFVEFCENLKKLADVTWNMVLSYIPHMGKITWFMLSYPESWDFLVESAQILGGFSPNVMGIGIHFLEVLYKKFPNNFKEILVKIVELWDRVRHGSGVLFMSSWLDFLAPYLDQNEEEKFFEMAEKMVNASNKYLTERNNGVFYSQKENPLTYGLGFMQIYLEDFPAKYDEILERVMQLIASSWNGSYHLWEKYFLGISNLINGGNIIALSPDILHAVLDFYEKNTNAKEISIQNWLQLDQNKFVAQNKEIELIFAFIEIKFDKISKNTISNAFVWLLQNNQDHIFSFIKLLFIIDDLHLQIDLHSFLDWELCNNQFQHLENEVRKQLKTKNSFKDDNECTSYSELVQEVFWERIDEKMRWFEKILEEDRKRNIASINEKQKSSLLWYRINISDYDEQHRTLVLYYRAENMNSFHFSLITHILYTYISSWYSKVFDRILVTSRRDEQYPHEVHHIWDIPYQYNDFQRMSIIFANTIHFTHGRVIENDKIYMGTTIPIIWMANLADDGDRTRVPQNGGYSGLHLKYGKMPSWYALLQDKIADQSWEFNSLFDEIIRAVRKCEDMMISLPPPKWSDWERINCKNSFFVKASIDEIIKI